MQVVLKYIYRWASSHKPRGLLDSVVLLVENTYTIT